MPRSIPTAGAFAIFLQGEYFREKNETRGRGTIIKRLARVSTPSVTNFLTTREQHVLSELELCPLRKNSLVCRIEKKFLVWRFATWVSGPRPCGPYIKSACGSFWNIPSAQGLASTNRGVGCLRESPRDRSRGIDRALPRGSIERPQARYWSRKFVVWQQNQASFLAHAIYQSWGEFFFPMIRSICTAISIDWSGKGGNSRWNSSFRKLERKSSE